MVEIDKAIDEKTSKLLLEYTGKDDRADISAITGISISTLRDVLYRTGRVTEFNISGVTEMVKRASENADKIHRSSQRGKRDLKVILDKLCHQNQKRKSGAI
ncbi:hypothetical protein NV63_06680 [Elizabethkingia anophelis]|nr:hypothetical protein NV63_06680 [Elizabethkingia anophelis]